jgi:hypothetical protein
MVGINTVNMKIRLTPIKRFVKLTRMMLFSRFQFFDIALDWGKSIGQIVLAIGICKGWRESAYGFFG